MIEIKKVMSKIYGVFTDKGEFSWRKAMTAGCLFVFMYAQIGYLNTHGFNELPTPYWAADVTVFSYYFIKNTLDNIRIGNNDTTK